jgi:hypothetical protein
MSGTLRAKARTPRLIYRRTGRLVPVRQIGHVTDESRRASVIGEAPIPEVHRVQPNRDRKAGQVPMSSSAKPGPTAILTLVNARSCRGRYVPGSAELGGHGNPAPDESRRAYLIADQALAAQRVQPKGPKGGVRSRVIPAKAAL